MSGLSSIALIGYGEVGKILAQDLAKARVADIRHYDTKHDPAGGAPDAVRGAQLIISAVTAAQTLAAAQSVVPGISPGAYFLDLNSASPGMKQQAGEAIAAAGGRYVEAAVMSPVPPKRIASPLLLGGPHAAEFLEAAQGLGLNARVFSDRVGPASATKMCRSVMIKGIEALLTESMLTARHYGVEDVVLASLSDLLPVGDWQKLARYMISRALEHGTRRAEEMREVARTVSEAGLTPLMSSAIAERQDWAAGYKSAAAHPDLHDILDTIRQEIDKN